MSMRSLYIGIGVVIMGGLTFWGYTVFVPTSNSSQVGAVVQAPNDANLPEPGSVLSINPSGTYVDPTKLDSDVPPPEGYVEYTNTKYGFSFYHAPESVVKEYDEGGGAMTVTLENFERLRGMQVFIVPYGESTISEERFHKDLPSGVRTNVANATIDGVKAVTFNSQDSFLGDTREIWFIHNGYLYEVTTFAGVANWFTPIIQSWKFL